jgi:hypothetical protein
MSIIEYAFVPACFFMFGAGFWLGMAISKVRE